VRLPQSARRRRQLLPLNSFHFATVKANRKLVGLFSVPSWGVFLGKPGSVLRVTSAMLIQGEVFGGVLIVILQFRQ